MRDERVAKLLTRSANVACEAVGAIRTVASLTRERGIVEAYERELQHAEKTSFKQDLIGSAALAVSTCSSFFDASARCEARLTRALLGAVFKFGANQLTAGNVSITGFFIALQAVIFALIEAGNVRPAR